MPEFSNDEINVMCIYDTGSRKRLIRTLQEMREYLDPDQNELRADMDSCVKKLKAMTDEQFAALADMLVPDF